MTNNQPRTFKELKALNRDQQENLNSSWGTLTAMATITKMNVLVPSIIRDHKNNVDFGKALIHIGVAFLPQIISWITKQKPENSSRFMDLLNPFIDQFYAASSRTTEKET